MSSARPHCPRPAAAALSVLLAVAFVGTNLAAFFHAATERHETCDEHGELIHMATAAVERDAAPAEASLFAAGETEAPGAEHGHCQLCPCAQPQVEVVSAPAIIAGPAIAAGDRALPSQRAVADAGIYRLAPKTSPPV